MKKYKRVIKDDRKNTGRLFIYGLGVNAELSLEQKALLDEFLKKEREDEATVLFEEKRLTEEDWHAEELEALESNQE